MHILPQEAVTQVPAKSLHPAPAKCVERKAAEQFTQCHIEIS